MTGEMLVSAGEVKAVQLTLVAMYEWYSGPVVDQGKCLLVERFMPDTKIPLVPLEKLELAPRRRRKPPLYPRALLGGEQPAGRSNRRSTGRER